MPYSTPTFGGNPIFGLAVEVRPMPNPAAIQLDAYQGVDGQVALFGGTRGGTIQVKGRLLEYDIPGVNADIATIVGYNDGIARTLTDCEGNSYYNAVFTGRIRAGPALPTDTGWMKEYECDFIVLSG